MPCDRSFFVDGAWQRPAAPVPFDVTEAATGAVLQTLSLAGEAEVAVACLAARRAFAGWAALPVAVRVDYLHAIADALEAGQDDLARAISRETGMPLKLSVRIQVAAPVAALRASANAAPAFAWAGQCGHSLVERVPLGVAGCVTPWNYPLHQIIAKIATALVCGCTVVLKPSEIAPSAAIALAEAVISAKLPAGVFNMVIGDGAVCGAALVAHPEVDVVSFTGSTTVGRQVAASAAGAMKRVSMELGGKSAAILLPGCDAPLAVRATLGSAFLNAGQTCSAITRLIVPATMQAAIVELARTAAARFTPGDPLDPATRLGPLATPAQKARVIAHIEAALAGGAELVCGGTEPPEGLEAGNFVRPTIFSGVNPAARIARDEVFGPVLCIIPYADTDEVIRIANGTGFGLAGAVWGPDDVSAMAVARQMRAGQIDINGAPFNPEAPFGGFGLSGMGRENGTYGFASFLEYRSLQLPPAIGTA
ncbi:aldehyde dehydrogenase family protein [Pararhodobacter sp.]|uniref:aldehyde dehydrogenase family protein n=1 Tax=Pararhodobacter sp. TaxID=2127056 RepID=UPI002FDEE18C